MAPRSRIPVASRRPVSSLTQAPRSGSSQTTPRNTSRLPRLSITRRNNGISASPSRIPPLKFSCSTSPKASSLPMRIGSQGFEARTVSRRSMIPTRRRGDSSQRRPPTRREEKPTIPGSKKVEKSVVADAPIAPPGSIPYGQLPSRLEATPPKEEIPAQSFHSASGSKPSSLDYYNYSLQYQEEDSDAHRLSHIDRNLRLKNIISLFDKLSSEIKQDLERFRDDQSKSSRMRRPERVWWDQRYFHEQSSDSECEWSSSSSRSMSEDESLCETKDDKPVIQDREDSVLVDPTASQEEMHMSSENLASSWKHARARAVARWQSMFSEQHPQAPMVPDPATSTVPLRSSSLRHQIFIGDETNGSHCCSIHCGSSPKIRPSDFRQKPGRAKKLLKKVQHKWLLRPTDGPSRSQAWAIAVSDHDSTCSFHCSPSPTTTAPRFDPTDTSGIIPRRHSAHPCQENVAQGAERPPNRLRKRNSQVSDSGSASSNSSSVSELKREGNWNKPERLLWKKLRNWIRGLGFTKKAS